MAAPAAADGSRSRRPGQRCAVGPHPIAETADDAGRPRGAIRLPLLRGGLRPAGIRKDERVIQIEGDPDSPISRGRLCPKGAASKSYVTGPLREYKVKYRRPHGTEWEELELDEAMDMIADRVIATRARTWQETDEQGPPSAPHARPGQPRRRDARQRGELPDQEADDRARGRAGREPGTHMTLLHRPRSGDIVRRGGATTFQQDLQNSDCILIMGSNMAECHPVGFQWVMEARERGAKVIHVDPRFTRTSAMATTARAAARGIGHRLPRRDHQLHPAERPRVPGVRRQRTPTRR